MRLGPNFMQNKTVLVTGASDGIGYETVKLYLRKSFNVIAHYASAPKKLEEIRSENLNTIQCDFSKIENIKEFATRCSLIAPVDVLINNAAYFHIDKDINSTKDEVLLQYVNVNMIAPFILCQEFSRHMIKNKFGKIVNISSVSVKHGGSPQSAFYTATKGALEQLTVTLSKIYAPKNININAIRVGVTNTKFHDKNPNKNLNERAALIPLGRIAEPHEVAEIIYKMTDEAFSFCAGSVYDFTGGE